MSSGARHLVLKTFHSYKSEFKETKYISSDVHLFSAVVAEIVYGDKKFSHHDDPQITAIRCQVQIMIKIAKSPDYFEGGYFLPHGFQKFAVIFFCKALISSFVLNNFIKKS